MDHGALAITEEMLIKYLKHHKDHPNSDENFILE
jgi:hypothetical protein